MPPKRARHRPAKKPAAVTQRPSNLTIVKDTVDTPVTHQPTNLIIIKDTVDKGKGVFASNTIPQGTCIVSEYPIVAFPFIHNLSDIIATVEKCTEEERNKILAFSYSPSKASLNPYHRVALTNCVPMAQRRQAGLFETICRINHDCRPNAMYSWNESLGKEVLYAMIEIPAGEEITVNYTTTLDRLKRRAELQSAWAFTCICQSCSLPPEELKKSDERIAQLSKIIDVIPILLHFNPVSAIANIRQALVIAEEERLYNQNYAQCGEAFQICAAFGDVVNAKVWAGRAADAYMRCYGADDEVTLQMRSYNEDPRRFSEWGQLGNRKLSS